MIRKKGIFLSVFALLITLPCFTSADDISLADSLYENNHFKEALEKYLSLENQSAIGTNNYNADFKIAYCYYRSNQYPKAFQRFEMLDLHQNELKVYTDYFKFKITLKTNQAEYLQERGNQFLGIYPDHFLADSVKYFLANEDYRTENYLPAYQRFVELTRSKTGKFSKPELLYKIAVCKLRTNYRTDALDRFDQYIRKYPERQESLEILQYLEENELVTEDNFFHIIDVLLEHGRYDQARLQLEQKAKSTDNAEIREKARFHLLQLYFEQGQYQSAIFGFKNILPDLKNENLKARAILYIARANLRLGSYRESADFYLEYSRLFPRKRLSAETAWKSAWIMEQLHDLPAALKIYQDIPRHWPRSSFADESEFREAFTNFRLGYYHDAISAFDHIIAANGNDWQKSRALYWKALTLETQGKYQLAQEIFTGLASNMFENYYAMRSYLRVKPDIDKELNTVNRLTNLENPLKVYQPVIVTYIEQYSRLFLIRELLGPDFVRRELQANRIRPKSKGEWIALAEVYKRLGLYDNAWRIYDFIDNNFYGDLEELDKPFILKEKYPLYFDKHVEIFSHQHGLDKNLVLAIIREESGFNKWAHSWADAYGLMQIIPRTAGNLSAEIRINYKDPRDLFNAKLNLQLGTYYLKSLNDQFDRRQELVLAAYNAGPHRVNIWKKYKNSESMDFFIENVEFSQTRHYVRRVLRNYWIYQLLTQSNY